MLFLRALKSWRKLALSTARNQQLKSEKNRKKQKANNEYAQKYR